MGSLNWFVGYSSDLAPWWKGVLVTGAAILGGVAAVLALAKEAGVGYLTASLLVALVLSLLLNLRQAFVWRDENAARKAAEKLPEEAERAPRLAEEQSEAVPWAIADDFYPDEAEERGFTCESEYWDQPAEGTRYHGQVVLKSLRVIQPIRLSIELSEDPQNFWYQVYESQAEGQRGLSPRDILAMRFPHEAPDSVWLEGKTIQITEVEFALSPGRRLVILAVASKPFEFQQIRRRKAPPEDRPPTTPSS